MHREFAGDDALVCGEFEIALLTRRPRERKGAGGVVAAPVGERRDLRGHVSGTAGQEHGQRSQQQRGATGPWVDVHGLPRDASGWPVIVSHERVRLPRGLLSRVAARAPDKTLTWRAGKKFAPHDCPRLCTMARQARLACPCAPDRSSTITTERH